MNSVHSVLYYTLLELVYRSVRITCSKPVTYGTGNMMMSHASANAVRTYDSTILDLVRPFGMQVRALLLFMSYCIYKLQRSQRTHAVHADAARAWGLWAMLRRSSTRRRVTLSVSQVRTAEAL
eukprot:COSAG02_NODE_231_length_27944_cov_5.843347_15_plen_123_part_00